MDIGEATDDEDALPTYSETDALGAEADMEYNDNATGLPSYDEAIKRTHSAKPKRRTHDEVLNSC